MFSRKTVILTKNRHSHEKTRHSHQNSHEKSHCEKESPEEKGDLEKVINSYGRGTALTGRDFY